MIDAARAKMINELIRMSMQKVKDDAARLEWVSKANALDWTQDDVIMIRGVILVALTVQRAEMIRYLREDGLNEPTEYEREMTAPTKRMAIQELMNRSDLIEEILSRDIALPNSEKEILLLKAATAAMMMLISTGEVS